MNTERVSFGFFAKLVTLVAVFIGPLVGCGSDEAAVDDDSVPCDEMFEGTYEAESEWAANQGIERVDYEVDPLEEQIVLRPRSVDGEATGVLKLSSSGSVDSGELDLSIDYEPAEGESIFVQTEIGLVPGEPGKALATDSRLYQYSVLESGADGIGFLVVGRLNDSFVPGQWDEENPLMDVEEFSIISNPRDYRRRAVLHAISEGDLIVNEEDLDEWADDFLVDDVWFEEASLESIAAIVLEANLLQELSKIQEACEASQRSGLIHSRSQAATVCDWAEAFETYARGMAAFIVSFVCGAATAPIPVNPTGVGICAMIPLYTNPTARTAGVIGGFMGAATAWVLKYLAIKVAWIGVSGAIALGLTVFVAVAVVFLIVVAAWAVTSYMCGNPLVSSVRGVGFPFRSRGEFIWYTHRARDALHIQIRQGGNPASSCPDSARVEAVAVGAGTQSIGIYMDRSPVLWIDGEAASSSQYFWVLNDGTRIERRTITSGAKETYFITSPVDDVLRVDVFADRLDLDFDVGEERRSGARGLIGEQASKGGEGLVTRDGEVLQEPVSRSDLYRRFGDSWRVKPAESLFDYRAGERAEDFDSTGYIPALRTLDDLTQDQMEYADYVCRQSAQITDPTLLHHCLLDVGCTQDPSYAASFSRVGPPKRLLGLVDDDGRRLDTSIFDGNRDLGIGAPTAPSGGFSGDDIAITSQATCPADLEKSAESVGSSRIRTIDGFTYEFRSAGEFVLVESTSDTLAVQVRQEPRGDSRCPEARRNTAVAAQLGDHRIGFYADGDHPITINGEPVEIAGGFEIIGNGHRILRFAHDHFYLEWPDRTWLDVRFRSGRLDVRFNAPYTRMGQLRGVFGSFNGYPDNDITLRSGVELEEWDREAIHGEFADSWRISDGESLFDYADGVSTEDYTDLTVPQSTLQLSDIPSDEEAAGRVACEEAGVQDSQIMRDCIIDVYCTGEPNIAEEHADREGSSDETLEWVELVPGSGDLCCHVDCVGGPDADCGFICGTGEFEEPHEWCDGDCPVTNDDCEDLDPDDACTDGVVESYFYGVDFTGEHEHDMAAYICATRCTERRQFQCIDDDGCCPAGGHCTSAMDNDCDIDPHVGSGCVEDDDCATIGDDMPGATSVSCLAEEGTRMFGGMCVAYCSSDDDCPAGNHCANDVLHSGGLTQSVLINICVPSCTSDDDCPREGYGCYDANDDGRTECWHMGTGDGDFGDDCDTSRDCGEIGEFAQCTRRDGLVFWEEPDLARNMCTQFCGLPGLNCPEDWVCDPELEICVQPVVNDIGTSCESNQDCESAPFHPAHGDRCFDEGDAHAASMPGGYCTYGCTEDSDCPDGARCSGEHDLFDQTGTFIPFQYCVLDCQDDSDCPREGYGCYDINFDGRTECWHIGTGDRDFGEECDSATECGGVGEHAICRQDYDNPDDPGFCTRYCGNVGVSCPEGWRCGEQLSGFVQSCIPDVENEMIGEACTDDSQCGEASDDGILLPRCGHEDIFGLHGGYCHIWGCSSDAQCPAGSHCINDDPLLSGTGNMFNMACVASCTSNADCPRDGYECYDANGDGRSECWHVGVGSGDYGDSCETSKDCSFGSQSACMQTSNGKVCTSTCMDDLDSCPDGYGCSALQVCIQECDDDDDCPGFSMCHEDFIFHEDGSNSDGCL